MLLFPRYKREAYRGSEFAPRILAENGIRVVLKVCPDIVTDSCIYIYFAERPPSYKF